MQLKDHILQFGFPLKSTLILPPGWVINEDTVEDNLYQILMGNLHPSNNDFRIEDTQLNKFFQFLKDHKFSILYIEDDLRYATKNCNVMFFNDVLEALVEVRISDNENSNFLRSLNIESIASKRSAVDVDKYNINLQYNISSEASRNFSIEVSNSFYKLDEDTSNNINLFEKDEYGEMTLQAHKIENLKIDFAKHYNTEFVNVDDRISKWIVDDTIVNKNLVLMNGAPGTGKSNYIQYLMNKVPHIKKIYIPPYFVSSIADPGFFNFIKKFKGSVLLIEDAEKILMSRESNEENSAISVLLNLTDGVLAKILRFKIICTFNSDEKDIDQALLRKGRLFLNYKFDKLSEEKTRTLYDELYDNDPPERQMTLADIYNAEDNGGRKKKEQRTIGFGTL